MDQFQEMNVDFKRSLPYQISVSGYIYAINLFVHLINNQVRLWLSKLGGDPLVEIGLRWLPKLRVDTSPRPHDHELCQTW